MIVLKNKMDCCGCGACAQKCPKHCISMCEDEQGFLYPIVDLTRCIQCGLCEKVCPVLNQEDTRMPLQVFAAKNKDNFIREQSSSGGIFSAIAEYFLKNGGVVFGAKFDENWDVVHDYTMDLDELSLFRGAKYVQSTIGDMFSKVEYFLKLQKKVLFIGTPCQISGLNHFLRKEYDNLFTVEIVCHGVPSPLVWKRYLCSIVPQSEIKQIADISFRNKDYGWGKYSLKIKNNNDNVIFHEMACSNNYLQGFIRDLYLRPSCYNCPTKSNRSRSDMTLGDFWGVSAEINDDRGISLVLINSKKGSDIYKKLNVISYEKSYADALKCNPSMVYSAKQSAVYEFFWEHFFREGIVAIKKGILKLKPSLFQILLNKCKRFGCKLK